MSRRVTTQILRSLSGDDMDSIFQKNSISESGHGAILNQKPGPLKGSRWSKSSVSIKTLPSGSIAAVPLLNRRSVLDRGNLRNVI